MDINQHQVKTLRTGRGWTQQQLADICALSLRTIQRVEVHGLGSYETVNALAAAFQIDRVVLLQREDTTTPPQTNSAALGWVQLISLFAAGVVTGAAGVWWWLS